MARHRRNTKVVGSGENGNCAVAQNSPAMTHPFGPLGALYLPDCGPVSVQPITWGLLKSRYLPRN